MINTIIFDLGAVLIDWHPFHLYKKIYKDEAEMKAFIDSVCTNEQFPEHEENIRAYYGRWVEMLAGPIQGTVDIFKQLKESGKYKIYALTNWSAETFPIAQEKFDFLNWFDGVVVSGTEKLRKPFPEFYQILLDRYDVKPEEAVFIDDNYRNVEAGRKLGIDSIHFITPEDLEIELKQRDVL
jgi:2-haloacid dehalogenase